MKLLIIALLTSSFAIHAADNELLDPEFMAFFAAVYTDPADEATLKLDQLAEKMAISEDQQTQWQAFKQMVVDGMQRRQQHRQSMRQQMTNNLEPLSAPQMLQLHQQNLAFQATETEIALASIEPLYSVLSAPQQRMMDRVLKSIWMNKKRGR